MRLKAVSVIILTLLLSGPLILAFKIQTVKASGIIYIKADGSIDPPTAPISTVDNITYIFTGDIYDRIVVERDNITIDGNGHMLEGAGSGDGITLSGRGYVTIKNAKIKSFDTGIYLSGSLGNIISGNSVTDNREGIMLDNSSNNNIISGNSVTANSLNGIVLVNSSNNTISGNNVTASTGTGIFLRDSSNSIIIGNSVTANYGNGLFLYGDGISLSSSSNSIISGNSVTANTGTGIWLYDSSNSIITGNNVTDNQGGIRLDLSSNSIVSGNSVTDNRDGIVLDSSSNNNTISGNSVTANSEYGIIVSESSKNTISGNNLTNNVYGMMLFFSSSRKNKIYHNNFIDNTWQAYVLYSPLNTMWDDGYPSGGNYWSDYAKADRYSGQYQNETSSDGIGDKKYRIDANNKDWYPLMGPIVFFKAGTWNGTPYNVDVISNSTVSSFQLNRADRIISFNVTGPDDTLGFCRVTIPNIIVHDLWHGNYTVLVDGEQPLTMKNWTDGTYTYVYFTYMHSEHEVIIVPEFPTWTSMLLVLIVLAVAIAIYKRRPPRTFRDCSP